MGGRGEIPPIWGITGRGEIPRFGSAGVGGEIKNVLVEMFPDGQKHIELYFRR